MTDQPNTHEEDEALAAEYVVGLLPMSERTNVEDRLRRDSAFAARVAAWEAYFAGLNADYGTLQPSRRIKAAIDARLFSRTARKRSWWLPAGLVATILVAALLFVSLPQVDGSPRLVAQLESSESAYRFAVAVAADSGDFDVTLNAGAIVQDRTFELWVIPPDGVPRSLGTFDGTGRLPAADATQIEQGYVLAVSLEPVGGSPTGAPTGPVLALGTLEDA